MQSQREKILRLLQGRTNEWVSLPEILSLGVAQYNARLFELRALGHKIENKTQEVEGVRHSWYRLVTEKPLQLIGLGVVGKFTNSELIS
jgi:biotin operon repressor